jgi:hypothetical protein
VAGEWILNRVRVYARTRARRRVARHDIEEDLFLMCRIDELHLKHPFYGPQRLAAQFVRERIPMNAASRIDRKSGEAKVAGLCISPLLRLPLQSDFFRQSKSHEILAPSASDRAWSGWIAKGRRQRSRLEAECLAGSFQPADLPTYLTGKSVRTTQATAQFALLHCGNSLLFARSAPRLQDSNESSWKI